VQIAVLGPGPGPGQGQGQVEAAQVPLLALVLLVKEGLVSTAVQKACFPKCSLLRILRCSVAGGCWGCWSDQMAMRVRDQGPGDRAQMRKD
jgi:hypothetical protein